MRVKCVELLLADTFQELQKTLVLNFAVERQPDLVSDGIQECLADSDFAEGRCRVLELTVGFAT